MSDETLNSAIRKIVRFATSEGLAQPLENKPNINVVPAADNVLFSPEMKKAPKPVRFAFRPTDADFSLVTRLKSKLGVDASQVMRIALRRLAEAEGMKSA